MRRETRVKLAALLAAALGAVATAHAGYRLTDERGMQTEISKGRVKQTMKAPVAIQSSIDVTTGRMWMANGDKKVVWEGPIDEFCAQMKQTVSTMQNAMKAGLAANMKNMPPEQRAKMEAMLKNMGGDPDAKAPDTKVVKTDLTETIAGLPTQKIQLVVDGQVASDYWVTTDPKLAAELRLDKAGAAFSKFRSCQMSGAKSAAQMSAMQDVFSQGFPLKTVTYANGSMAFGQSYDKVETADLPDATFAPPQGFTKVTLQEAMFAGMPGQGGKPPLGQPKPH